MLASRFAIVLLAMFVADKVRVEMREPRLFRLPAAPGR